MKYVIMILLSISLTLSGQEFSNPSYGFYDSYSNSAVLDGNFYGLYRENQGTIILDGVKYKEDLGCKECERIFIAKYDSKNKVEKVAKIASKEDARGIFNPKIISTNNKIFIVGNTRNSIIIDGVEIGTTLQGDTVTGIILEFDAELNFIKKYDFSDKSQIKDIDYYNGEYFISGIYGDTIVSHKDFTLKHKYKKEANTLLPECFIMVMDTSTGLINRGISFGGPSNSTIEQMEINGQGELILMGYCGEVNFVFGDYIFNTNEFYVLPPYYLLSISIDFDLNFFKKIDSPSIFSNGFVLDEEDNIFIQTYGDKSFSINEKLIHSSDRQFAGFTKLDSKGSFVWFNYFQNRLLKGIDGTYGIGPRMGELIVKKGRVIVGGVYSDTAYIENINFPDVKYNRIWNALLVELDASSGKYKNHHRIGSPMPIDVKDMRMKEDNSIQFIVGKGGTSVAINLIDQIFVDMLVNNYSTLIFDFKLTPDGINDIDLVDFAMQLYPTVINSGDVIYILLEKNIESTTGSLYDVKGNLVQHYTLQAGINAIRCEACLPSLYYFCANIKGKKIFKKVMIN